MRKKAAIGFTLLGLVFFGCIDEDKSIEEQKKLPNTLSSIKTAPEDLKPGVTILSNGQIIFEEELSFVTVDEDGISYFRGRDILKLKSEKVYQLVLSFENRHVMPARLNRVDSYFKPFDNYTTQLGQPQSLTIAQEEDSQNFEFNINTKNTWFLLSLRDTERNKEGALAFHFDEKNQKGKFKQILSIFIESVLEE